MNAKDAGTIALSSYAYVSLFGIQSLDELKYVIFENTVSAKDIGLEPTIEGLKENAGAVLKRAGRHSIAGVLSYFKNVADAVKMVSFLSVTRQIICIDDIERKGKNLRTQDVLGLVSLLRERRKCKVVIILNDDELDDDDKGQLAKYHEKVIDSSLLFAPTPQDCVEIAIPQATGFRADLAKNCVALSVSNIRVIKKIERLAIQVEPLLTSYDTAVLAQAIQTLTLFGWAHFGRASDSDASFISYVVKHHDNQWFGPPSPDQLAEGEKKWAALLDSYGFTNADEFDLVLLDAVRNGFIDVEQLQRQAQGLDEKHKTALANKSLNDAWSRVHDSFDDNEQEVVEGLVAAYKDNMGIVTPGNLDALMGLLKDLGHDDLAREGLILYMQEHENGGREFYDVANQPFLSQFNDPDLKKAFDEKLATFKVEVKPASILERIEVHQGWSNRDIAALSAMSVADYKRLFKTLKGPAVRTAIRAAIGFERISNRGTEYDSIINNARQALTEIAAESVLNKRRVQNLTGPLPAIPVGAVPVEAKVVEDDE